jgi:hypothetical protein
LRAIVAPGVTLGALVDLVVNGAADNEREMVVEFLRAAAQGLPDEELFPPNLTGMVMDLLFDLSDAIENCEHHDADETNETETLQ